MRRSETIELIANAIYEELGTYSPTIAEIVLDKLEAAGMLPPTRDRIIEKHLCEDNSWEPEHEKK